MAETKARPTRRAAEDQEDAVEYEGAEETEAQEEEQPKRRRRAANNSSKFSVYFDDYDASTLTLMGEYKAVKPEEALQAYLDALEPEAQTEAIEASTYAVETPKGLVRLAVTQTITIARR